MREAVTILIMYLALKIPWTNGIFFALSFLISVTALFFLILMIAERFIIGGKFGYRMDIERPRLPPLEEGEEDYTPRNDDVKY